jgi:hypothetical protein
LKKILAAAAMASLAGLTACSVATPAPENTTSTGAPTASAPAPSQSSPSRSAGTSAPQAGGVKAACETFNSLYANYKAIQNDSNAYEDIYLAAQDAKGTVSGNLVGLFASLSVLALDHSSAVDTGGQPDQKSKDAVRDAVFANAGECTAAGVTLRL